MASRLKNGPRTYRRAMDVLLRKVKCKLAFVHLDDIVISWRTLEEHIDHVWQVLTLLHGRGVTLSLKKCGFFTNHSEHLGRFIRPGLPKVSTQTIDAIRRVEWSTTVTGLRSFKPCAKFLSVRSKFCSCCKAVEWKASWMSAANLCLNNWRWDHHFGDAQSEISRVPRLALPRLQDAYTVDIDACNKKIGIVILQKPPEVNDGPIAYWSRSINDVKGAYYTIHPECMAEVRPVLLLRQNWKPLGWPSGLITTHISGSSTWQTLQANWRFDVCDYR